VSSQNKALKTNADGSVDVYFGPRPPKGLENNWVQTIPGKGWFMILRLYGPARTVVPQDLATGGDRASAVTRQRCACAAALNERPKAMDPTGLNWPARRAASCAGGSSPGRSAPRSSDS